MSTVGYDQCGTREDYQEQCIGVNISERKSGAEGTKKRELVKKLPLPGGATSAVVHRLDATWIFPELR